MCRNTSTIQARIFSNCFHHVSLHGVPEPLLFLSSLLPFFSPEQTGRAQSSSSFKLKFGGIKGGQLGGGGQQMVACSQGGPCKGPSGFNTSSPLGARAGGDPARGTYLSSVAWPAGFQCTAPCFAHIWRQPWGP